MSVVVSNRSLTVNSGEDAKAGLNCAATFTAGNVTSAVCKDGKLSVIQTCGTAGGCCIFHASDALPAELGCMLASQVESAYWLPLAMILQSHHLD